VIKVNISEIKNRLSYYLKLVKGGEEIEIIDRKTPLARIIRIGDMLEGPEGTSWVKEVYSLGIVTPPHKEHVSSDFTKKDQVIASDGKKAGVLNALLNEREKGR